MTRVGFVGLGAMGLPMAVNLVEAGYTVSGYDVRGEAAKALAAAGGRAESSAAQAAREADILFLMVVDAEQAESVLFAEGALEATAPNAVVTVMATCPPHAIAAMAERGAAAGRRFVDAPVSGGIVGAEAGTLTIMAAAPRATFEEARPVLETMGDKLFHVGEEPGQGATVKTVNQLLCGVHIAAAAEGLALAERIGVDPQTVLEILGGSAASSWMLKDRGPRMLMDEPPVTSAVDIFVKDLGIVLEAGADAGMVLPQAREAHAVFTRLSQAGMGKIDDSQAIRTYRDDRVA